MKAGSVETKVPITFAKNRMVGFFILKSFKVMFVNCAFLFAGNDIVIVLELTTKPKLLVLAPTEFCRVHCKTQPDECHNNTMNILTHCE